MEENLEMLNLEYKEDNLEMFNLEYRGESRNV